MAQIRRQFHSVGCQRACAGQQELLLTYHCLSSCAVQLATNRGGAASVLEGQYDVLVLDPPYLAAE